MKLIALTFLALVLASVSQAAEYFVSERGNDSAQGNAEAAAFATVAKGLSALKAGDTLTVLPGEYHESLIANVSGTAEAPVTIRAKRPGTALFRGDVEVASFRPVPGLRHVFVADFQRRVESVAELGTLRTLDPRLSLAEVEMTLGSYLHDEKSGLLYVHSSDSRPPDEHRIAVSVTNACGLALSDVRHVIVDGLSFTGFHHRDYNVQHGSRTRWGLFFRNAEHVTVRRCTAYLNSGGIGFLGGGQGCVVEDCLAFANESRHIDIGNNINGWSIGGMTFRRNRVEGHSSGATSKFDITFYSGREGCVMEDNIALNAGLMIKGGLDDAIQRGNVVVGRKFYRDPDATNLELPGLNVAGLTQTYADPLNADFRLQTGARARSAPRPASGDVFYVSPQGDDAADGASIGNPWRSLAHAARLARPGNTIYLLPGTYAESLAPVVDGRPDAPIRFARHGHGLVVLEGGNSLDTGVDLSRRKHVEIRGLVVRRFRRFGVFANSGSGLRVEQCVVHDVGGDAAAFGFVNGLQFTHNLTRHYKGAGLRLHETTDGEVAGNLFAEGPGTRLICDAASLARLWSDRNAFEPGATIAALSGRNLATLADWQEASQLDARSLAVAPKLDLSDENGMIALAPNSPLIGAGPHAQPIGPFLRLAEQAPLPIEGIAVRGVTHTTANLEWWLPTASEECILQWGETPDCEHKLELEPAAYHSASLVGLQPATTHYFRLRARRDGERLRFATAARDAVKLSGPKPTEVQTFATAARAPQPRTLHVALNGDDSRDGLTAATAWQNIAYAAANARAGDTVLVHGGEYEEFVPVRSTGDAGAPLTFKAAPGEVVWLTGSGRTRHSAFLVTGKHHVVIDGLRFRDFNGLEEGDQTVRFEGGSGHVVRRCFFDGRVLSGYVNSFLGATGVNDLLVENNVVIGGMGDALSMSRCPSVTVRNNVIYLPSIRALTCSGWDINAKALLTHNIIFDTLPSKTNNPLIRLMDLENLVSGHNLWFTRTGPGERYLFEPMRIGDKDVWTAKPGSRVGKKLLQADLIKLTGQDATSVFANPELPVLAELYPSGKGDYSHRDWLRAEMHLRDDNQFAPLGFQDFLPVKPLIAADGKPIGLDPEEFR